MTEFKVFESIETASVALAGHIAKRLEIAVTQRGSAAIVVSGGASPLATFRALRRHKLPWHKVTVVPSDERLVPPDHEDSNEGMIRRELMQEEAAAATLFSLAGATNPEDMQLASLNTRLGKLASSLDLVLLGMGDDGHTASLFPDSPDIAFALSSTDFCVVQRPAHLEVARLSLTPALLIDAKEIILLFFGASKRAVYDRAIAGGDVEEMPVRFVLHQQLTPVSAYWAPGIDKLSLGKP
jgi:6-phosphogluconolactonase